MRTKYERGKTLTYPTMYPKLLITPIFARRDDWKWVEEIRCRYDAGIGKEPEFSFVRDTARSETVDRLTEENQRLRELVCEFWAFIVSADVGESSFMDYCVDYCEHSTADDGCCKTGTCFFERKMRELGIEVAQ